MLPYCQGNFNQIMKQFKNTPWIIFNLMLFLKKYQQLTHIHILIFKIESCNTHIFGFKFVINLHIN